MFRSQPKYEVTHICGTRKVMFENNNGADYLVVTDGGKVIARFARDEMDQAVAVCEETTR